MLQTGCMQPRLHITTEEEETMKKCSDRLYTTEYTDAVFSSAKGPKPGATMHVPPLNSPPSPPVLGAWSTNHRHWPRTAWRLPSSAARVPPPPRRPPPPPPPPRPPLPARSLSRRPRPHHPRHPPDNAVAAVVVAAGSSPSPFRTSSPPPTGASCPPCPRCPRAAPPSPAGARSRRSASLRCRAFRSPS